MKTFLKIPVWINPDITYIFTGECMYFLRYIDVIQICRDVDGRAATTWNSTEIRKLRSVVDNIKLSLHKQNGDGLKN